MDLWPVTILRWFLHPRSTCNFLTLRDSSLELWPVTILWCFFHARSTCPATFKWFTSKTNVLVTWSKRLLIIALCFSWRAQRKPNLEPLKLSDISADQILDTTKWWKWCFPFSSPPRSWTCEFPQYFAPINLTPPPLIPRTLLRDLFIMWYSSNSSKQLELNDLGILLCI